MDLSREAIEKIEGLVTDSMIIQSGGKDWTAKTLHPVVFEAKAEAISGYTLKGLCDYINHNIDQLDLPKYFVHVLGVDKVSFLSSIRGELRNREKPILVSPDPENKEFSFGTFMTQEEFIIRFRAGFQQQKGDDFDEVLSMVKKVTGGTAIELDDDGITQTVEVKRGVTGNYKELKSPKPIVNLSPYRTFRDIDQVRSEFLFRLRLSGDIPSIALFEADGGRWRIEAASRIEEYITSRLPNVLVII